MMSNRQDPCKVCTKKEDCPKICEEKTDWLRRAEKWLNGLLFDGLPKCDYSLYGKNDNYNKG